jgi:hypothetical protein
VENLFFIGGGFGLVRGSIPSVSTHHLGSAVVRGDFLTRMEGHHQTIDPGLRSILPISAR